VQLEPLGSWETNKRTNGTTYLSPAIDLSAAPCRLYEPNDGRCAVLLQRNVCERLCEEPVHDAGDIGDWGMRVSEQPVHNSSDIDDWGMRVSELRLSLRRHTAFDSTNLCLEQKKKGAKKKVRVSSASYQCTLVVKTKGCVLWPTM
jgi:hypothetical protein